MIRFIRIGTLPDLGVKSIVKRGTVKSLFLSLMILFILIISFAASLYINSEYTNEEAPFPLTLNTSRMIIELYDEADHDDIKGEVRSLKSKDKKYVFAKLDDEEIQKFRKNNKVKRIWPDLETQTMLNSSTSQINTNSFWSLGLVGTDVKIAILDTGIDPSHEMFDNVVQEDFTGTGVNDTYGHGTHCAGIAAGDGQYRGVAYNATLYSGKVLDDNGYGQLSWLINGIDWAIEQDVDVISLSLGAIYSGSPEDQLSSPEVQKVEEAVAAGITVVVASGNCGSGCGSFDSVTTPGIARNVITVGAVDSENDWASFSSGDEILDYVKPDVVAPGVDICSSVPGGYDCFSGTSMTTPFVAGAAALLLQNESNTPIEIKQMLENSAVDLGVEGKDVKYGSGLIDLSNVYSDFLPEDYFLFYNLSGSVVLRYYNHNSSPLKLTVEFELMDLDGIVYSEERKTVPKDHYRDFEFSWQPMVAGKYILHVKIMEKKLGLLHDMTEEIFVQGEQVSMIEPVRMVLR